jgi:hypothetical protein
MKSVPCADKSYLFDACQSMSTQCNHLFLTILTQIKIPGQLEVAISSVVCKHSKFFEFSKLLVQRFLESATVSNPAFVRCAVY